MFLLVLAIFIAAQIAFALLLRDISILLCRLLRALDDHVAYTIRQDINSARLGTELHEKLDTLLSDVAVNDDSIFRLRDAIQQEGVLTRERDAQATQRQARAHLDDPDLTQEEERAILIPVVRAANADQRKVVAKARAKKAKA